MELKKIFSYARLKRGMMIIAIIIGILFTALLIFYFWGSASSLPQSRLSEIIEYPIATPVTHNNHGAFTLMTYNIGYLSGMTNNRPVKTPKQMVEKNMETFLHLLDETQPDIVGFQEIDYHSKRSHYVDQLRTIAEKAGYPYAAKAVNWDKRYVPFPYWPPGVNFGEILSGQAALSRYPIISTERVVLEKPKKNPFYYNAFYLDRLAQVIKLKIGPNSLIVINIQLDAFDRETREKQANVVLDIYRTYRDNYPVLITGDFNCVPPDAPNKKYFPDEPGMDFSRDNTLSAFLNEKNLKAAELEYLTFPSNKPTRKLDYVFYDREKIDIVNVFAPKIDSSDHLPLVIQFSLKKHFAL